MAIQISVAAQNGMLDSLETTIGTTPLLRVLTGSQPANCATASSGTLVAECTLPSDWLGAASANLKSKSGTWEDTSANATGTAGYYRIFDSTGTTCHWQGSVTAGGGGGDMTVDSVSFVSGQPFTVLTFTIAAANS